MNFMTFLRASPRFLAFGFAIAFFSSFGQTYFISLSSAHIREAFELSHGDFGMIFAVGSLSSAVLIIWAGNMIDSMDLRLYTSVVCIGLACACIGMSVASSALWLLLAVFGLRFCGQGLMTHISTVSMARYFGVHRGKAISISTMGFSVGEAIFPTLVVAIIAFVGWRQMWGGIGIGLAIILVPLSIWLLKGHKERHQNLEEEIQLSAARDGTPIGQSRSYVLRDPRFYILLPVLLAPSFVGTGLFFHQVHLVDSKGWSMALFASSFAAYALTQALFSLLTGFLADKYGALNLLCVDLLPLIVALVFLGSFQEPWVAIVYMLLAGATFGAIGITRSAMWAELYGVKHLGSIKALATALMVLSSALAPPVMGIAIDAGVTMETIALVSAAFCGFGLSLVIFVLPRLSNR